MLRLAKYMIILAAVVWAASARAEDAYYYIAIDKLDLTEGKLPKAEKDFDWRNWQLLEYMQPYAVLDSTGEAYVQSTRSPVYTAMDNDKPYNHLAVCAPSGKDVTGRLFLPKSDCTGYEIAKFKIPASAANKDAKSDFLKMKIIHYQHLLNQGDSGSAWFRHQLRQAQKDLGQKPGDDQNSPQSAGRWGGYGDVDSTYDLFTGGRAISENVQIDRIITAAKSGDETVDVDSLQGITINQIDWKPLLKDLDPKLDPLADKVPFDQHVVFFPTFQAALAMSDESKNVRGMFFKMTEQPADDTSINARYEKQLCLSVSSLGRMLGPNW